MLPPEMTNRALRIKQVAQKLAVSEATVWRLSSTEPFPKPIKLSPGCTVWLEAEIDHFLWSKTAGGEIGGGI